MFKISNKNCQRLYNNILCDEEIDSSLNPYKDILKVILEKTNYTPVIKELLKCLFCINLDENLLINNSEYIESFEDFEIILNTRKVGFDLHNPILYKIIKFYKESDIYNSNNINSIEKILYGLSTDYKKVNKVTEHCSSRFIIDLLIKMIFKDKVDIEFFMPELPVENLYSINEEISILIYNIYDEIIKLKEKYSIYIDTLGRMPSALSKKLVFWDSCINYFLNSQEHNYICLKTILNNSIYDDTIINSFNTVLLNNRSALVNYFDSLFFNCSIADIENIELPIILKKEV